MTDLATIYYDPSNPAGYSGVNSLINSVKNRHPRSTVEDWLKKQDAYTIHKPVRKTFPRNKYIVSNMLELWQADLCDMRSLSKHNDENNFILTVIDVFSKMAWARPLKSKTAKAIINAFKEIFQECGSTPLKLQTDKGKEFVARPVQKFFKELDINFHVTNNPDVKAAVVERFNRTLKTRMWRYFTYSNSYRYIDVLRELLASYNNRYHSSIKMAPNNVNEQNVLEVWNNLYRKGLGEERKPKFKVDQHVRISRTKSTFEKGYETNWSEEIFKIYEAINRKPPVYRIIDLDGEVVEGTFYEQELQAVTLEKDRVFKINKVLSERGRGRSKEYLVSWRGYSDKFNSWIPESELRQI